MFIIVHEQTYLCLEVTLNILMLQWFVIIHNFLFFIIIKIIMREIIIAHTQEAAETIEIIVLGVATWETSK